MFKAIARFFRYLFPKKKEQRLPTPHIPASTGKRKRIALIIGHSPEDKGATAYTGEQEFDWNMRIAKNVLSKIEGIHEVEIFYRNGKLSYKKAMKELAKRVAKWKPDLTFEFHFNAYRKVAYGCEILVAEDANNYESTIRFADNWTDKLANRFGLKERHKVKFKDSTYGDGVKVLGVGERAYWNFAYYIDYKIPYSFLIEPMFANTKNSESVKFFSKEGEEKYADCVAEMLSEF